MNWYTAECLFRSVHENSNASQLLELRYFLLTAEDDESAKNKALELARRKQHSFVNVEGIVVEWIFQELVDVKEVLSKEISEGTEVYYKYLGGTTEHSAERGK